MTYKTCFGVSPSQDFYLYWLDSLIEKNDMYPKIGPHIGHVGHVNEE